jgi:hypothetical protein
MDEAYTITAARTAGGRRAAIMDALLARVRIRYSANDHTVKRTRRSWKAPRSSNNVRRRRYGQCHDCRKTLGV